jgi:hypothetical protein
MKTCLKILFWGAIALYIASGVAAAYVGNWTALVWIIAATMWMIDAEFSGRRADRLYRELIEALEESAKVHFDCFELTIKNYGLETKNYLLENDYNKRQIRRKMHFDRLRKAGDK